MGKLQDPLTGIWWFDRTQEVIAAEAAYEKLRHARAFDSPLTEYISSGPGWSLYSGTVPTMRKLTLTQGDHTTLTVTDSRGNAYASEESAVNGEVLTHTATADTGYTLSVFTVGGVDKLSANPFSAAIGADLADETAATINTYAYTATTNDLGTIVMLNDEEEAVTAGATAVTHFEEYSITITPADATTSVVTVTNNGAAVELTDTEGVYTATIACVGAIVATIAAAGE